MKYFSGLFGLILTITTASLSMAADVTERAVPNSGLNQPTVQAPTAPIPTMTVEQRLAAMQQQITLLQSQIAALQSVMKIGPTGAVSIVSNDSISMQSAKSVSIHAGQNVAIQSGGTSAVEGKGGLDLKGQIIKMNGGNKPIAMVGSAVGNGAILTGSGAILGN